MPDFVRVIDEGPRCFFNDRAHGAGRAVDSQPAHDGVPPLVVKKTQFPAVR